MKGEGRKGKGRKGKGKGRKGKGKWEGFASNGEKIRPYKRKRGKFTHQNIHEGKKMKLNKRKIKERVENGKGKETRGKKRKRKRENGLRELEGENN